MGVLIRATSIFPTAVCSTVALYLSGCNVEESMPPEFANACYIVSPEGDAQLDLTNYAKVSDLVEGLNKVDDSSLKIEKAGDGFIIRASITDKLSETVSKIAFQFDKSAVKVIADSANMFAGHCGPSVYTVSRVIVNNEEKNFVERKTLLGVFESKSAWSEESKKKIDSHVQDKVPTMQPTESPSADISDSARQPSDPPEDKSAPTPPYEGTFSGEHGLRNLAIRRQDNKWIAKFEVGTEGGRAADCNISAESSGEIKNPLPMVLLDDDGKTVSGKNFLLLFKEGGIEVQEYDDGGNCGLASNLYGFYPKVN